MPTRSTVGNWLHSVRQCTLTIGQLDRKCSAGACWSPCIAINTSQILAVYNYSIYIDRYTELKPIHPSPQSWKPLFM